MIKEWLALEPLKAGSDALKTTFAMLSQSMKR